MKRKELLAIIRYRLDNPTWKAAHIKRVPKGTRDRVKKIVPMMWDWLNQRWIESKHETSAEQKAAITNKFRSYYMTKNPEVREPSNEEINSVLWMKQDCA